MKHINIAKLAHGSKHEMFTIFAHVKEGGPGEGGQGGWGGRRGVLYTEFIKKIP